LLDCAPREVYSEPGALETETLGRYMRQWYVVHCRANSERRAETNLERQNYKVWLPLYRKTRRHARKVETVLRPLFPRYLFVRLDIASEPWRPILSTFGVHNLVSGAEGPAPIGDDIVAALQARAGEDGVFEVARSAIKPGDQVRVQSGPMADLEGIFQAELDSDRVLILLKLMGREVRVSVASGDVEPL
jgi:transcriptional antiterminator RfaH